MKHIELKAEDFSGLASVELEKSGWIGSVKGKEIVWNYPGSFGSSDLCWQDALQVKRMVDKWGEK